MSYNPNKQTNKQTLITYLYIYRNISIFISIAIYLSILVFWYLSILKFSAFWIISVDLSRCFDIQTLWI